MKQARQKSNFYLSKLQKQPTVPVPPSRSSLSTTVFSVHSKCLRPPPHHFLPGCCLWSRLPVPVAARPFPPAALALCCWWALCALLWWWWWWQRRRPLLAVGHCSFGIDRRPPGKWTNPLAALPAHASSLPPSQEGCRLLQGAQALQIRCALFLRGNISEGMRHARVCLDGSQ